MDEHKRFIYNIHLITCIKNKGKTIMHFSCLKNLTESCFVKFTIYNHSSRHLLISCVKIIFYFKSKWCVNTISSDVRQSLYEWYFTIFFHDNHISNVSTLFTSQISIRIASAKAIYFFRIVAILAKQNLIYQNHNHKNSKAVSNQQNQIVMFVYSFLPSWKRNYYIYLILQDYSHFLVKQI